MAYPEHALLQFGGTLGEGVEIWSCGIRMSSTSWVPGDGVDMEQYLDDVAVPALSAWMLRATTYISLNARLTYVKFNSIDSLGHYVDRVDPHERLITPVQGSASGTPSTFQVSYAVTWETDVSPTALASRGRIYVPMPGIQPAGGTCLFSPAAAIGMAESAATLVEDLTAATGVFGFGDIAPYVVSGVRTGAKNRIVGASVDNRLDVIRRRANAIDATRFRAEVDA